MIACRSEPAPLSFVLVTEKVDGSQRISRSWKLGRYERRFVFARFAGALRRPVSGMGPLWRNLSLPGSRSLYMARLNSAAG
jgi:hypothetical protein